MAVSTRASSSRGGEEEASLRVEDMGGGHVRSNGTRRRVCGGWRPLRGHGAQRRWRPAAGHLAEVEAMENPSEAGHSRRWTPSAARLRRIPDRALSSALRSETPLVVPGHQQNADKCLTDINTNR
jgi:hypothetical protein